MHYKDIGKQVEDALMEDPLWEKTLQDLHLRKETKVHLAIFVEPFLSFLLDGSKTIESRFSKNRISPYKNVNSGDILLIKKSGGPICAIAKVGHSWFYEVDESSLKDIRRLFSRSIKAQDDSFWESKSQSKYVSLMQIVQIKKIPAIKIYKLDRRGWVTFVRE